MSSPPPLPSEPHPPDRARQPRRGFVSPDVRTRLAAGFAGAALVVALLSAGSSLLQVELLERALVEEISAEEADANDRRERLFGFLGLVGIAEMVFFFAWTYRVYKNLRPLRASQVRFTPGGSVGWYFCPILNLWKPLQAMDDIWHGSVGARNSLRSPNALLVGFWWVTWLASTFIGQASMRLALRSVRTEPTVEELIRSTWVAFASEAASVLTLALTIVIVLRVGAGQIRRHREMVAADDAPG